MQEVVNKPVVDNVSTTENKVEQDAKIKNFNPGYDWDFLLDQDYGVGIVKKAVEIVNRAQNVDLYDWHEKKSPQHEDASKLANDTAEVIKLIGNTLQSMASGEEVACVGDLMGMYAHTIEMLIYTRGPYSINWAKNISLRIRKLEQKIRFIRTDEYIDHWNCVECNNIFMTRHDSDDVRYCPYCGTYEENIIKEI